MKLLATLGLFCLSFLCPTTSAPAETPDKKEWLSDLDQAAKLAATTGRPLLIVFR